MIIVKKEIIKQPKGLSLVDRTGKLLLVRQKRGGYILGFFCSFYSYEHFNRSYNELPDWTSGMLSIEVVGTFDSWELKKEINTEKPKVELQSIELKLLEKDLFAVSANLN